MFTMMKTLFAGSAARNEAKLRDHYALDLIDQKIRETETTLKAAKATLASQIQRSRSETAQRDALNTRIKDLVSRAQQAMEAGDKNLAHDAAAAIADMENEAAVRTNTLTSLNQQIERIHLAVEKSQRRLIDLKQGAMTAKSVRAEQKTNVAIARSLPNAPAREAQDLIDEVLAKDSPSDLADIFEEIEDNVTHKTIEERLGDAGFGSKSKVSAEDVLARFSNSHRKAKK